MTPRAGSANIALLQRLAEANATINALLTGQIDAVVESTGHTPVLLAEAQAALRSSESQLREKTVRLAENIERTNYALRAARMGLWEQDLLTNELRWSAATAAIFGLTMEQTPTSAEAFLGMVHADDRQGLAESLVSAGRGGADHESEFRVVWPDGSTHWIAGRATLLRDANGAPERILGVVSDISERKALEAQYRQSQKMDAIGQLAGGVAHDFNNMLGVILGHADLALLGDDLTAAAREALAEIRSAAERSAALTRQLLTFARRQEIRPTVLDLNAHVAGSMKMLQRLIGADIALGWLPAADVWPIRMDPSQTDQVLMNLCVNARDAIADVGTLTIATANCALDAAFCAAHADATEGEFVRLTVSDTGRGMADDVLMHVFEPFFTTKGVGEGTGLGLATVYGVLQQNNGFITVSSEVGSGTTFAIFLPRSAGVDDSAADSDDVSTVPRGHETILVVDDDPAMRRVVTAMLTSLGYTVRSASGPTEAMQLARDHPGVFDLLLADMVMPGMNGRTLAAQLPDQRVDIKRLFMSGFTGPRSGELSEVEREHSSIAKPFALAALASKVREVLDRA